MTHLSDRALLVQLSISQWTARKYDKRASREVTAANTADIQAGRFNKRLLPMNDYLDRVHKKSGLIRTKYYANTLPWGMEGTQMLPTSNYLEFMTEFRKEKNEWYSLVSDFLDNYEDLKRDACLFLGKLYDPADYPSLEEVRGKFNMDMAVFPVPTADFRVQLADTELDAIQKDVESRVQQAAQQAMQDVWKRLYDRVKAMADKLSDPKAIFRDSLVENAREICMILPRLNFTDDPNLEALRQQVETGLSKHSPDALRHDPQLRSETAVEAQRIVDAMRGFMGV